MYDLHYWPTPNGKKVTILLEELGVPYTIVDCNIGRGDQFTDDFLRINPNHRMPALVDHAPKSGGAPLSVFESGAIMLYIAEKEGRFWPQDDAAAKYDVVQWVMWQMANQGPKTGERGHFSRVPESEGDQAYAKRRFADEVHRMYGVLNNRLYDREWLAGEYSIADMICFPWTATWKLQGIDLEEFKYFKRWHEAMSARPAVVKGMAVTPVGPVEDPASLSPEEQARRRKMLYNQRARPAPVA